MIHAKLQRPPLHAATRPSPTRRAPPDNSVFTAPAAFLAPSLPTNRLPPTHLQAKESTKKLNPENPKAKPSSCESMLWTNASGFLVALVFAAATGHLQGGLDFCVKNPECM